MAEYITVSDIKHRHIKAFPVDQLEEYVATANMWFEDYAKTLEVAVDDIATPISSTVRAFILAYMYMEFARDAIGGSGTDTVLGASVYESIYAHAKDQFIIHKPRVTKPVIEQTAETREEYATSFGKKVRG